MEMFPFAVLKTYDGVPLSSEKSSAQPVNTTMSYHHLVKL